MSKVNRTGIQWCDYSVNPIRARNLETGKVGWHCERVSDGCKNCYSATLNRVYGSGTNYAADQTPKVEFFLDEKCLQSMLTFKPKGPFKNGRTRAAVFPFDMTDVFGSWVPDEWIDRLFAVFAIRADVDWLVLTKRSGRMRDYLRDSARWPFPLPNVWLGVSAESRERADERIPDLLSTPAAVRFVSAEPCLSNIDLSKWLHESKRAGVSSASGDGMVHNRHVRSNLEECEVPRRRSGECSEPHQPDTCGEKPDEERFVSPGIVSGRIRGSEESGGPSHRVDDQRQKSNPVRDGHQPSKRSEGRQPAGESRACDALRECSPCDSGIGIETPKGETRRVELVGKDHGPDSGDNTVTGCEQGTVSERDRRTVRAQAVDGVGHSPSQVLGARGLTLDWVIVGGESGPKARPCDVSWIRSIKDQCQAAGVPVFVKQLGSRPIGMCPQCSDVRDPLYVAPGCGRCCGEGRVAVRLKDRKGGDPSEWPEDLRVREFPR